MYGPAFRGRFAGMEDELGWEAIAGEFLTPTSPSTEETIWEGWA